LEDFPPPEEGKAALLKEECEGKAAATPTFWWWPTKTQPFILVFFALVLSLTVKMNARLSFSLGRQKKKELFRVSIFFF
tara:strand:- start:112 stop:348 length:237 start_codon:yes stop_codon:yes gene_type:complete